MLRTDVRMSHRTCLRKRDVHDDMLAARREIVARRQHGRRTDADGRADQLLQRFGIRMRLCKRRSRDAALFAQQAEQQVLRADIGMSEAFRFFDRPVQRRVGLFGKPCKLIH